MPAKSLIAVCLVLIVSVVWAQDPTIKKQCAKDWPTDYRMQRYCIEKQIEAVNRLKPAWVDLKKGTPEYNILIRCYQQWPNSLGGYDHSMVLYCLNQQLKAYRELYQQ